MFYRLKWRSDSVCLSVYRHERNTQDAGSLVSSRVLAAQSKREGPATNTALAALSSTNKQPRIPQQQYKKTATVTSTSSHDVIWYVRSVCVCVGVWVCECVGVCTVVNCIFIGEFSITGHQQRQPARVPLSRCILSLQLANRFLMSQMLRSCLSLSYYEISSNSY